MIHNSLKWYQTLGKDLAAKDKTKEYLITPCRCDILIVFLQLATAYFSPRKGSKYAKRLYIFVIVALMRSFTQTKRSPLTRRLFCTLWSGLGIFLDIVWGGNILVNTKTG